MFKLISAHINWGGSFQLVVPFKICSQFCWTLLLVVCYLYGLEWHPQSDLEYIFERLFQWYLINLKSNYKSIFFCQFQFYFQIHLLLLTCTHTYRPVDSLFMSSSSQGGLWSFTVVSLYHLRFQNGCVLNWTCIQVSTNWVNKAKKCFFVLLYCGDVSDDVS